MGVVSEPIVVDGIAYVSAPLSKVYAVDAATGKLLWKFDPQVRLNLALNGSYSARTNGGVAAWEGKVYVGTGDCRLVAIDAASAKQIWESTVCDPLQTGITGAPHVAHGKIVMGFNGSDDAVRGAIAAYDGDTGKELWRFWTVPGDPSKPFESKALEMAAKSWTGEGGWRTGGGGVWSAITYDEADNLVIFGTAGAGADYGELAAVKAGGEKLFSQCIVAVNADTGEYVWHYQTGTEGVHSENNHIVMADLDWKGEKRRVAMTAPKNGFFYVLDANTGKLLAANPLVKTTWATSYNLQTGKPVLVPVSEGGGKQWTVHNWWPMSYNPQIGLMYIPSTDRHAGTEAPVKAGESGEGLFGRLIAWDPIAQKERWSVREEISVNGGVLSTAGNLVFKDRVPASLRPTPQTPAKNSRSAHRGSDRRLRGNCRVAPTGLRRNFLVDLNWSPGGRLIFVDGRDLFQNRIDNSPRLFHIVLTGKQCGIAGHRVSQYSFVCIHLIRLGVTTCQHLYGLAYHLLPRRHYRHAHGDGHFRADTKPQVILRQGALTYHSRRQSQTGDYLCAGHWKGLPCSNEERDAFPTPRIDVEPKSGKRLNFRVRRHSLLLPIAPELTADKVFIFQWKNGF